MMETDPQYLLKKKERQWCKEKKRRSKRVKKGSRRAFSGQEYQATQWMPRVSMPFLCSVEREVKLYGKKKTKKSEPPMWPVVDHTHIPRDLSLPSVNGGRAMAIHGPCHLLNNSDAESLWGGLHNSTWSFHFLESLGTRGGWESHPVKQESCGECTLPSSCNGTSHPGHQCLWFGLLFPFWICLVTHMRMIKAPRVP